MPPDLTASSPTAVTLADFTSAGLIVPQLRNHEIGSVLQELSQALERENRIPDLVSFYHSALKRELLVSTEMEAGMAFPHARLEGLSALSFALGRSAAPLDWGKQSTRSVRLVFLIAVPEDDVMQYLALISGLARLAKDPSLTEKLSSAGDATQIIELLRQIKLRSAASPVVSKPGTTNFSR